MRPSEALLLGSTILKAKPYVVNDGEYGCAYGMMDSAAGLAGLESCWSHERPCGCTEGSARHPNGPEADKHLGDVAHIFNEHVCGDKTWTIEMLADWLRSKESPDPPAPAGEVAEARASQLTTVCEGVKR